MGRPEFESKVEMQDEENDFSLALFLTLLGVSLAALIIADCTFLPLVAAPTARMCDGTSKIPILATMTLH